MNALEIAARNYFANVTGCDPMVVDVVFDQDIDGCASEARDIVAAMLAGSYGTLSSAQETTDDVDLIDAGIDGYVTALYDTIDHIDNCVIQVPCECAAVAVHNVLALLKQDIETRIAEVQEGTAEDPTMIDPLQDLFSFFFGGNFGVVELEPTEG